MRLHRRVDLVRWGVVLAVILLFVTREQITSTDETERLSFSQRMARVLLNDCGGEGWLTIADPLDHNLAYALSARYLWFIRIVSWIDSQPSKTSWGAVQKNQTLREKQFVSLGVSSSNSSARHANVRHSDENPNFAITKTAKRHWTFRIRSRIGRNHFRICTGWSCRISLCTFPILIPFWL